MKALDRKLPPILAKLHRLPFDYDEDDGIDFEPYEQFESAKETTWWLRAWTGNQEVDGSTFRIFGQDGTGGYAAFWLVREGKPLSEQPIVFFGSEGELGVVARDLSDYLWLLAGGIGPYEAVASEGKVGRGKKNAAFADFAAQHAPDAKKSPSAVIRAARKEFPDFEKTIRALCR
jgi:hypothetical protein